MNSDRNEPEAPDTARRPEDDTRCPTCGGSAHALTAAAAASFGGQEYRHRYFRKALDTAWSESDRLARELDTILAYLRGIIENCKTTDTAAIRHQLVGIMPEVQPPSDELRAKFPALADQQDEAVRRTWAEYGYPEDGHAA